ncbi:hypothetical protein [Paenibacillus sp. ACRRY]|nr:hypothetical protein [Paenibacillus sp. ACRRY]
MSWSSKQFRALINKAPGTRENVHGDVFPITRTLLILRADPGTSGFLDQ